jgi:hypothetical protein
MENDMRQSILRAGFGLGLAVVLLLGSLPAPGLAHHSFSMYDQAIEKTVTGQLTRFVLGANHAQIYFELVGPDGEPELDDSDNPVIWGVETGSAAALARRGITVKTFEVGTIISVTLNPLRDGRNFGAMTNTTGEIVKCGMTMPEGGCTEETGEAFMRN